MLAVTLPEPEALAICVLYVVALVVAGESKNMKDALPRMLLALLNTAESWVCKTVAPLSSRKVAESPLVTKRL